ncbi:MAG: hypothetical protein ABFC75_03150 [Rectinema sp.]
MKKFTDGRVTYGIPLWYRIMMAVMIAAIGGSMTMTGEAPGVAAWIMLAILALGLLYEERWDVDPKAGTIQHRGGLLIATKRTVIEFDRIEGFALTALAKGTVPGGESDRKQSREAFAQMNGHEEIQTKTNFFGKFGAKRSFINLVLSTNDGSEYLVDTCQARRAARLKIAGISLAEGCGKSFSEKIPE